MIPSATYRAQFTPEWRFDDAASLADYFAALGISHIYSCPVLEARAGSTHGYDVTDPGRIRGELGGRDGFLRLARRLQEQGLGIVLDIVPNHMAADHGNPWWWDVLKYGPRSAFAGYFDIDWERGGGKVVLPVLGKSVDEALAAGELALAEHDGEAVVQYFDRRFPVAPGTLSGDAALGAVLEAQHYRLMYWRDGLESINYRRFFDVSDLVSLRAEDPRAFEDSHRVLFELVGDGWVHGARVDHIDGLLDPTGYLHRLRQRLDAAAGARAYLIVEKILSDDEALPERWPVDGSSGYEFMAFANRLFVDVEGAGLIEADAQQRLGAAPAFEAEARQSKRYIIRTLFQAELRHLTALLAQAASPGQEFSTEDLEHAIVETTAAMEVYRTYLDGEAPSREDVQRIEHALDTAAVYAKASGSAWGPAVDLLRDVLVGSSAEDPTGDAWRDSPRGRFVLAWQQFTSPAMAKGVEDTALYRRITLASLNDVGCEPDQLPADPAGAFHAFCKRRLATNPGSLNATSTHDTKRGEDTRLRISTLSEMPQEYLAALDRWFDWHAPIRAVLPEGPAPSPSDEVLIYQCLLAIWPTEDDDSAEAMEQVETRLIDYMIKAAREAKVRSTWHDPDEQYEEALRRFIEQLVRGEQGERFRVHSAQMRRRMATTAMTHSLAQVVLKCAAPGVPDFYRGAELWDLSLVDPDNRRPVDYQKRRAMLETIQRGWEHRPDELVLELLEDWYSGAVKMFTMLRALSHRSGHVELFERGEYIPLVASGEMSHRIVAFARRLRHEWVIAIVPRLGGDTQIWETQVQLPSEAPRAWRNVFVPPMRPAIMAMRNALEVDDVLHAFPVALLEPM